MVSIPDWSRLGRLLDNAHEVTAPGAKYNKHREVEAVKQAEEHGYFLNVSKSYLESTFVEDDIRDPNQKKSVLDKYDVRKKDLRLVQTVKLVNAHTRSVGDIGLCTNLTVCILSNNHITKIDGLISCTHLQRLDIHSNQISMLPGSGFWMCLRDLKLLNLHDNPIGRLENLNSLSSCPSLLALTLYDTPLSLKRNYRHHVVNSVWSLKALDSYVISDEEIIEDANWGGRFAAMYHSFAIDLCPSVKEDSDYDDEYDCLHNTLAEINTILAHNSPVLIIQRYVRGFLIRKIVQFDHDLKHWEEDDKGAAMTIQRKYRGYKGLHEAQPPPSTPAAAHATKSRYTPVEPAPLDYDTYMKNRRPGSRPNSQNSLPSITPHKKDHESQQSQPYLPTPVPSTTREVEGKRQVFINLAKLQSGTLQSLHDDALTMESFQPSEAPRLVAGPDMPRREKLGKRFKTAPKEEKKKRVIKSVKQFFGPVVETVPSPQPEYGFTDDEEEIPLINYRLKGLKRSVQYYDPMSDMIMSKKEAGHDARLAESDYHRKLDQQPKPVIEKQHRVTDGQRMFNRVQGTMGLSCLWAVHQAYKDRSKAERSAVRMESVLTTRDQRDAAKERIKLYHEERRLKAIKDRETDKKRAHEAIEKKELARLSYVETTQMNRKKSSQYMRRRRRGLTFVSDFMVQNNSVSNALLRHDRQARVEDKWQDRSELYSSLRNGEKDQQDVVKKYLEHRQLMRQTETAMHRASLDTKMLQEANDRIIEAKARVSQLKARSATVEAFYPLPTLSNHPLPSMPKPQRTVTMEGLNRFESGVVMHDGRVGRHHTQVTM